MEEEESYLMETKWCTEHRVGRANWQ